MRIVAAAISYRGMTISMPAPARHADILRELFQINQGAAVDGQQGFLADTGQFYGRIGAKQIVKDYGQSTIGNHNPTELFSEDLW